MIKYNSVPHLRIQKTKLEIPFNPEKQLLGSAVFISTDKVEDFVNVVNSNLLYFERHYYHFTPLIYNETVFNRRVVERPTLQRKIENEKVIKQTKLRSNVMLSSMEQRNVVYNLGMWNEIFKKECRRQPNFLKRTEEYFRILNLVMNNKEFDGYPQKTLIIDIDSIGKNATNNIEKIDAVNNPLSYLYHALRKNPSIISSMRGTNIVLYSANGYIKLDPSQVDRNTYSRFKLEMQKLGRLLEDDDKIEKDIKATELVASVASNIDKRYNFTGEEKEIADEVIQNEMEVLDKEKVEAESDFEKRAKNVEADVLQNIAQEIKKVNATKMKGVTKRDEALREKQRQIKVENGKTVEDVISTTDVVDGIIPITDVSDVVDTTNPNITKLRYVNFDKVYNEKFLEKDIMNTVLKLNDAEIPVYIRDVKIEDTSDELNAKKTYEFHLEDELRQRHIVKVDVPKFIDSKFLYLNGNRKVINRQFFLKPIIKIEEDTVQIVSNYNKIFIRRYGRKLSVKTEKFRKVFDPKTIKGASVKLGNNLKGNKDYITTIEYDELSKVYDRIKIGDMEIYFNQTDVRAKFEEKKIKIPENQLPIGFKASNPLFLDTNTQRMFGEQDLVDYIIENCPENIKTEFGSMTVGKKYLYSRATIMARDVPLILLIAYCEGLTTVLRKAEIKHYFTDKRPKISNDEGMVRFANGYLVYNKYPLENSLLMNAFEDIPTAAFDYESFDAKETYVAIFDAIFSQRNLASAFDNFYDFMIDPITKEVLEHLDQPTEFVDVVIYANKLLADNNYSRENDMNLYRIRSNEIISVYLYKALTRAYGDYRRTAYNNNPQKISIRKNAITREVLMAQTIEDYSVLNPVNIAA